jgi:hypothetical protein
METRMTTLVFTYLIAWAGIAAYGLQLFVRDRQLTRRLREPKLSLEYEPYFHANAKRVA